MRTFTTIASTKKFDPKPGSIYRHLAPRRDTKSAALISKRHE
jgi:hypothetical protein